MEKSPKDKMIKDSPRKKGTAKKKIEEEEKDIKKIIDEEEKEEEKLSARDEKEVRVIERVITTEKSPELIWDRLNRTQVELIKRTVAKGATDDELKMFLNVCVGAQLNPFLRQVHFVKRWDSKQGKEVGTIQVGIDGFRAIAESGGQYAGSDDAVFRDEAEVGLDVPVNGKLEQQPFKLPGSATVTVYKLMEGNRYPFTATARWDEYYPGAKTGYMWRKMPYNQLAKCAEALALRKAFPKLLSGMYSPEEMDQAGGKAQSPEEDAFDKAKKMIGVVKDVNGLKEAKDKIEKSSKYDSKQKKELAKAIDERVSELDESEEPQDNENKEVIEQENANTTATP